MSLSASWRSTSFAARRVRGGRRRRSTGSPTSRWASIVDEYPDSWPEVEAWDIVDDRGERRYDMILVPNGGYIWPTGSTERVARVIQEWLSLDEKPDPKLERKPVIALLEAKSR
jgi:hypothetical protein